jgi:nucleotide-sensitive chloride channel 1A
MSRLRKSNISFLSATNTGFAIDYPSLTLHAISPASGSNPAFLYCQVDVTTAPEATTNGDAVEQKAEDEEDSPMREVRIYVRDPSTRESWDREYHHHHVRALTSLFTSEKKLVEKLFEAMSLCASLHPSVDTNGEEANFFGLPNDDDDDDDQGAYDDAPDDAGEDDAAGRVRPDFQTPDSRFRPY